MYKLIRAPLSLMALTIFIDFVGFGLILPSLPFWAQRFGAGPLGVGLVLTSYALAQFLFTPLLGSLSDRYGRRPIILAALFIEALSLALSALATSLPILLAARFIGGLGASNIGSAQAVVADVTPAEGRARGMGLIGAAIGLGFVVGPALGGALAPLGMTAPFWVAMLIALINILLVLRFLPETRWLGASRARVTSATPGTGGATKGDRDATVMLAGWRTVLHCPIVARLVLVNLLFMGAFSAMEAVFALFTQRAFGWAAMQNGYIFTYIGVLVVLTQGGLVALFARRWGEQRLLLAGLLLETLGLASLTWSTHLPLLLLTLGIVSVGDGAVTPMISSLLSFASPPEARGETLGLAQAVAALARVIGPLAAGGAFAVGGPAAPFLASSALVLLAVLIVLPARTDGRKTRLADAASAVQSALAGEATVQAREK
jgi:DHA1 family tetracycline resistance protein-like MFS transporter